MVDPREICRSASVTFTKFSTAGNEHSQVQELSTSNRQILQEPAVQCRTRLLTIGFNHRLTGDDSYRIACRLFESETYSQSLRDLQHEAILPSCDESGVFRSNPIVA